MPESRRRRFGAGGQRIAGSTGDEHGPYRPSVRRGKHRRRHALQAPRGGVVGAMVYDNAGQLRDMRRVADLNGNGGAELVILQQRRSNGQVQAQIKDARTGVLIRTLVF